MPEPWPPKCDSCDAPAVTVVRDIVETNRPGDGQQWKTYRPAAKMRCGCADHPPEPSRSYRADEAPDAA